MSKIEVDQLDPQSGTELTIGSSGDTIKTGGNLDPNNNKVIIAFGDGGGHDIGALIGTVSGTGSSATISCGSVVTVNT